MMASSFLSTLTAPATTSARLAVAIALFITAEDDLQASRNDEGYFPIRKFAARREAYLNLKTIFELEFPA
ncbi:hypothetical protein [Devosia sp.]|uniref:hypothetical protein n=1 Tax=Devosia sp. TaxID=1871048 RepID=UPI001AC7CD00|nr:hypothetical protein [Devosia sp.]MBN9334687.1 hypothetical protein [Devosia sp.]